MLRHRGRRLLWRDVKSGKTYTGTLTSCEMQHGNERYTLLELRPAEHGSSDHPPPLYEPVLLGFAPIAFRLRGFERIGQGDNAYSVVQEWHVEEP